MTDCHFKGRLTGVRAATNTKRDRTRDALLTALQELLLDPDSGGVSVPQLVERAGVSQGTFYNYFDSLTDAIDAVGMLLLLEHSRVLGEVAAGAADPVEVISRSAKQTLMLFAYRPDVGCLLFDSGLPVDRFLGGLRAHLRGDLQAAVAYGAISVTDLPVTESLYSGTMLGACLDIHRGRLDVAAVPVVAAQLLRVIGVGARRVERLANAPQEFIQCRALPLTTIAEDQR
ncbi:MAG: TetR family transcriptional regulator [Actinobacteria bacterium]|nr:TetR family transcriptional regulator [Actinomycetota bacterium]